MKIGYPSTNLTLTPDDREILKVIGRKPDQLWAAVAARLDHLMDILEFNIQHRIFFFRIQNDLVPYARKLPECFDFRALFDEELEQLGAFIREHDIRVTVHPDLDVMLNHPKKRVRQDALADLAFQCDLLDALGVDETAKIQIHVGDRFDDAADSIRRFVANLTDLPAEMKRRLVIENETVMCDLSSCLDIHRQTSLPVVFDVLHHSINQGGQTIEEALSLVQDTWREEDGLMMIDYSSQAPNKMPGKHRQSLDEEHFLQFITDSRDFDFDLMLEHKDREHSAIRALELLSDDPRLNPRALS